MSFWLKLNFIFSSENLFVFWATIGKQCFDSEEKISNNEFLESATSALRAITQKLQDSKSAGFLQVFDDLLFLIVFVNEITIGHFFARSLINAIDSMY